MGKPTAVEASQNNHMRAIAKKLRSGSAVEHDRDEALAMLLEVYIAEREIGLVSVDECANLRGASRSWNAAKAFAVVISVITVCGTMTGIVHMIVL